MIDLCFEQQIEDSFSRMADILNKAQAAIFEGVTAWARSLALALEPAIITLTEAMQIIHDAWWRAYSEAGMPYGDSDDGMYAWLEARSKAQALRREADEIESHLEWLAEWRRKVKATL
jgi:hypothetical protein